MTKEQEILFIETFKSSITEAGYEVRFRNPIIIRVIGVHEGELILAVSCRVFNQKDIANAKQT